MSVNGSFLDKNGLTYLWSKIKAKLTTMNTAISAKASVNDIYGLGTAITSGSDLDDFDAPGAYYYSSSASSSAISNLPMTGAAFRLEVRYINSSARIHQTFIPLSTQCITYVREHTGSGWGAWHRDEPDFPYSVGTSIANGTDIFTLPVGKYNKQNNITTLINIPEELTVPFYCEIVNTISSTRRRILLYPSTVDQAGITYMCMESGDGYGPWFKMSGTQVDTKTT